MENKVRKLVLTGLMTALVYITTTFLQFKIPFAQGGYINLGDGIIFIAAILLGWKYGAFAGGIGSALADILSGYAIWALPTLIIKSLMGAVVGFMAHESKNTQSKTAKNIISMIISGGWVLLGLYLNNLLNSISTNTELSNYLMKELEIANVEKLLNITNIIQVVLIGAIIVIPLLIIGLFIYVSKKYKNVINIYTFIGMTLSGLIMIIGYFFAQANIMGNIIAPIFSIPFNIIQFLLGIFIASIMIIPLKKHLKNLIY